jgi:antitoxin HigA-1
MAAPNVHPGEVLLEEFMKPLGISQNRLARDLKVPPRRINEIVLEKRSVTPDTALRLARYFRMSERFWIGLQVDYDLEEVRRAWEIPSRGRSSLYRRPVELQRDAPAARSAASPREPLVQPPSLPSREADAGAAGVGAAPDCGRDAEL